MAAAQHRNVLPLMGIATIAGEYLDTPSRFAIVFPNFECDILEYLKVHPTANKLNLARYLIDLCTPPNPLLDP